MENDEVEEQQLPPTQTSINELPIEILELILSYTDNRTFCKLRLACKAFCQASEHTKVERKAKEIIRLNGIEFAWKIAALTGDLEVLKWLYDYDKQECSRLPSIFVADSGNIEVLEWLYQHITEYPELTMDGAAINGHLAVVKWLHENRTEGCTARALEEAAEQGYLEVVKFLYLNRKEGNVDVAIMAAEESGHSNVAGWLRNAERSNKRNNR
eukprot:TRINITY_DN8660_c1_g1_i1.p1 TRINITY_DN8660_c1_g1~~TRINITY_DN8660_c1_g1_i1.p1  ORF type:complete len:213 (-),score=37.16 TRINITY_DN8660_c1_g1_i1:13-651(-)